MRERGYMSLYSCFTSLYSRNYYSTTSQIYYTPIKKEMFLSPKTASRRKQTLMGTEKKLDHV